MTTTSAFRNLFYDVKGEGLIQDSRFGKIIESETPLTIEFEAGLLVNRPRLNLSIGWQELMQLIGGIFDPESIKRVAPNARHELFTAQMAYGPRIDIEMP